MSRRRSTRVVLLPAAALVPAVPTQALPAHQRYVALGDSFTAGPFIPQWPANLLVVRSATDVSRSGADPTHLSRSQQPADGDHTWIAGLEAALNTTIAAATAINSSYVDVHSPSLGHGARAQGAAWVNGDRHRDDAARSHPVRAGMKGVSGVIYAHLTKG